MQKRWIVTAFVSVAMAGVGCSNSEKNEQEVKLTMDQVPAAVKATLDREAKGAQISQVEKETKEGKTCYEADATIDGKPYEIKVASDGTLLKKKMEEKGEKDKD